MTEEQKKDKKIAKEMTLIASRRLVCQEMLEQGKTEKEICKAIKSVKYEPRITEIHNAEKWIEKFAQFYHARESDCPDSFKYLMLVNNWHNPFIALNELLKVIYTNERILTKRQKKGYKSRYRELEGLVQKYSARR